MSGFFPIFLLALAIFGTAIAAMALGVMFKRPCLRGSCGGAPVLGPDGKKLSCEACPNRKRRSPPTGPGGLGGPTGADARKGAEPPNRRPTAASRPGR